MRRFYNVSIRFMLLCSALLLLSILFVGSASAHAHLKSSTPSDGEVLTAEPTTVSAVYEEETSLTKTTFEVSYAKTASDTPKVVAEGKVDVNDRTKVSADLRAGLGDGVYTVKWHTLTEADNGIVDGSFSFTVAGAQTASGPTGNTGTQVEQPTATASGSDLPNTGEPNSMTWPAALLVGLVLLGGGFVLRRRALR